MPLVISRLAVLTPLFTVGSCHICSSIPGPFGSAGSRLGGNGSFGGHRGGGGWGWGGGGRGGGVCRFLIRSAVLRLQRAGFDRSGYDAVFDSTHQRPGHPHAG